MIRFRGRHMLAFSAEVTEEECIRECSSDNSMLDSLPIPNRDRP